MKKLFFTILVLMLLAASYVTFGASSDLFYTISCNPAEDASTSMNIVWHTDEGVDTSYLLYTKESDTNWLEKKEAVGTCELNTAFTSKNASGERFLKNCVTLNELESGTRYMYKITNGVEESEVRYFTTGSNTYSFVWISDFHAYYDDGRRLNNATSVIEKIIGINGKNDFILSTGDTIAHGGTYKWWKQVSNASWMKQYMFATTLGNHDWMTSSGTNVSDGASNIFMDACNNNPKNGYEGQENICYYFYYGDSLFIVLNTEEYSTKQYEWAEEVLKNNTAQYIFMVQHYQAFGTNGSKGSTGYTRWHNLCDKYGVDIFFSGNSHVYVRSKSIYNDSVSSDATLGTVYMVAPSSDGDRGTSFNGFTSNKDLLNFGWAGGTTQVAASYITVTPTGIVTTLYNKDGSVLDSASVNPKRSPSSRNIKDLTGFDKEAFESKIGFQTYTPDLTRSRIKYPSDAFNVVRNIKIIDERTNEVMYDGSIKKNTQYLEIPGIKKGLYNLTVVLSYYDNVEKTLTIQGNNFSKWGSIENLEYKFEGNKLTLSWSESITVGKAKNIGLYINDNKISDIEFKTKNYVIEDISIYNLANDFKAILRVYDNDDDLVGEFLLDISIPVTKTYSVKFIGKDGSILKEETVEEGKSAASPAAPLVDGFTFKGWDKEFTNVTEDLVVTALYEAKTKSYSVKFIGKDGSVLKEEAVEEGKVATSPAAPIAEGFTFKGWDKEFTSVTEDLVVTALYEAKAKTYSVKFIGKDGSILKEETVEEGKSAASPAAPLVDGFTFTGWDKEFTNVTEDLVVTALYEAKAKTYSVKFIGKDGSILKEEAVEEGKAATSPAAPQVNGFTFKGWDKEFANVTEDLVVTALYEAKAKTYSVKFIGKDGSILKEEAVEEGKAATSPAAPQVNGFTFKGWDKEFTNVTENLVVTALYEEVKASGCFNSQSVLLTCIMLLGVIIFRRKKY